MIGAFLALAMLGAYALLMIASHLERIADSLETTHVEQDD